MNVKMYLPNAKFFIGVLIVLAVTVFALKAFSGNAYVQKARGYLGLSV